MLQASPAFIRSPALTHIPARQQEGAADDLREIHELDPGTLSHVEYKGTAIFQYLRNIKHDLTCQNNRVSVDINNINTKIDSVLSAVSELKSNYEQLKQDNISLQNELSKIKIKLDYYENNSRRNNLRFNGIRGSISEHWSETETKLRDFLRTTLNFEFCEEADQIDIDRAHRIGSNNSRTCTIIARFVRFKDCQVILNRASNSKSDLNSGFSVQQDYSDRVKRHR
jgi:regulator of replication initiation timing